MRILFVFVLILNLYAKDISEFKQLLQTIIHNQPNKLKILLNKGYDINATDEKNRTLLMVSASNEYTTPFTKILLQYGIDVNATDINGYNALLFAIHNPCNYDNVKYLLDAGIDVNYKNKNGLNALYYAITYNKCNIVLEELIKHKVNLNQEYEGGITPLLLTFLENDYDKAKIILKYIKIKNQKVLLYAITGAKRTMFKLLIKYGYRLNKKMPMEFLNIFIATKEYNALKEYFEKFGLDGINLSENPLKVENIIVKLLDEMDINRLSQKQILYIVSQLYDIKRYQVANKFLDKLTKKPPRYMCYIKAGIGEINHKYCNILKNEYIKNHQYGRLSWLYLILGEYDKSINMANKSLQNKQYYVYSNMAHAYLLQNHKKEAYQAYKKFFEKLNFINGLHSVKEDFDVLKKLHPNKAKEFNKAYEFCKKVDKEVFK